MMLKNFLFYAFSTFINTWAAEKGGGEVFRVFGITSLALMTLCIPMCKSCLLLLLAYLTNLDLILKCCIFPWENSLIVGQKLIPCLYFRYLWKSKSEGYAQIVQTEFSLQGTGLIVRMQTWHVS